MELKKKNVLWILQMEIIVDPAKARGVGKMNTVNEYRSFKKFDWEMEEGAVVESV